MKPKPAVSTYEKEPFKLDPEVEFDVHIDRGIYLLKKQKYDQAAYEFRKLIEIDPKDAEAHELLGKALFHKGEYDEALKELSESIKLTKKFGRAHYWKSIVHAKMGQKEESDQEYEIAHDYGHEDIETMYEYADEMYAMGRYVEAFGGYSAILEHDPDDYKAHIGLGKSLFKQGDKFGGQMEFGRARASDPDNPSVWCEIGDFMLSVGWVDEAREDTREAQKLDPNSPELYKRIGDLLQGRGKIDEAILEYRKAIRQRPDDAELHVGLGDLLREKGMNDEALREQQRAKKLSEKAPLSKKLDQPLSKYKDK